MAKTIASPDISKTFNKAGKAFHLLEVQGVDPDTFLQKIINEPKFREVIYESMRAASATPTHAPPRIRPVIYWTDGGVERLVRAVCHITKLEPDSEDERTFKTSMQHINKAGGIDKILEGLDSIRAELLWLRFNKPLTSSEATLRIEIAKHFGISYYREIEIEKSGLNWVRAALKV